MSDEAALALSDGPVTALSLDGAALTLFLDDGASAFTAALTEDALMLTPADSGEQWRVAGAALRMLADRGIARVTFTLGDSAWSVATVPAAETTDAKADEITDTAGDAPATSDATAEAGDANVNKEADEITETAKVPATAEGDEANMTAEAADADANNESLDILWLIGRDGVSLETTGWQYLWEGGSDSEAAGTGDAE